MLYSKTDSGLLVAEGQTSGGERAVARALKDHDRDLRLVPQFSQSLGQYWAVYVDRGSDRPADFLMAWLDPDGKPLPPSMRLVEMVKQLDKNSPVKAANPDELNRARQERIDKETREFNEDRVAEWAKRDKSRMIPHRSQALRMSRDKQRARGKKV